MNKPRTTKTPSAIAVRRAEKSAAARRQRTDGFREWMHAGLRSLPHASTVLALGCDQAFLAAQLSEYSSDVTVLDTSAGEIALIARRFPEVAFLPHQLAKPLPFAHDTFDAIWCCEFLDRVFDPAAALRDMHRVLAPGGRLLVTVPDHGALRSVLLALFPRDRQATPANPRIRHFTKRALANATREAGFIDIAAAITAPVRRAGGRGVPRSLLLKARKDPGERPLVPRLRVAAAPLAAILTQDLAFAGR